MEDSLKQLKRLRADNKSAGAASAADLTASQTNLSQSQATTPMSDDDKVRLQLYIDVCEFGSILDERFKYKGGENYESLFRLVDEVKKQIDA